MLRQFIWKHTSEVPSNEVDSECNLTKGETNSLLPDEVSA